METRRRRGRRWQAISLSFSALALVLRRELLLLHRSRTGRGALSVLLALAWMPVLLPPLRAGSLGISSLVDAVPLTLALGGVVLPLVGLLAGAETLASEIEDGTLVAVLTVPVGRDACFLGKGCGRALAAVLICALAYGSALLAMALSHGPAGAGDYLAVAGSGLLLLLTSGSLGLALGAGASSRLRAFGAALLLWLLLVFVVDALLLAGVVALSPPAPEDIGAHGHSELAAPGREGSDTGQPPRATPAWLMTLAPGDLYRLTSLALGPEGRSRLGVVLPDAAASVPASPMVVGWAAWLALPLVLGLRRFRGAMLR